MRDTADNLAARIRQVRCESTLLGMAKDAARALGNRPWTFKLRLAFSLSVRLPLFLIGLPAWLCYFIHRALGAEVLLAMMALAATIATGWLAGALNSRLHTSRLLRLAACLPLADTVIARYTWRLMAVWSIAGVYLAAWALILAAVCERWGMAGVALGTLLAVAQGALWAALGTWLAVNFPRFPWNTAALGTLILFAVYVVCCIAGVPGISGATSAILVLSPAGWLNSQLVYGYAGRMPAVFLGLVPFGIILRLGLRSYRQLLATYRIREIILRQSGDATARTSLDPAPQDHIESRLLGILTSRVDELSLDDVEKVAVDQAIARIRTRDFVGAPAPVRRSFAARGERLWLSPRENVIFEFLTNDSESWPVMCWGAAQLTVILLAADFVLGWWRLAGTPYTDLYEPLSALVVGFAAVLWLMFWAHSGLSGPWLGMGAEGTGGIAVPRFALVPVGFDEISGVMLKVNAARLLLVTILASAQIWLVVRACHRMHSTNTWFAIGIAIAVAVGLMIVALVGQALAIAGRFWTATTFKRGDENNQLWVWIAHAFSPRSFAFACVLLIAVFQVFFMNSRGAFVRGLRNLGYAELGLIVIAFCSCPLAAWLVIRMVYRRALADLLTQRPAGLRGRLSAVERGEADSRRRRALRRRYGWLWRLRKPPGAAA